MTRRQAELQGEEKGDDEINLEEEYEEIEDFIDDPENFFHEEEEDEEEDSGDNVYNLGEEYEEED